MMLPPNRHPPIVQPTSDALLPTGNANANAAAEPALPHGDYNHQPLLVGGLEHYVKPTEDERFHVS